MAQLRPQLRRQVTLTISNLQSYENFQVHPSDNCKNNIKEKLCAHLEWRINFTCKKPDQPKEYVKSEGDRPNVKSPTPDSSIPIIDMKNMLRNNYVGEEMLKLHMACPEWGYFSADKSTSFSSFH